MKIALPHKYFERNHFARLKNQAKNIFFIIEDTIIHKYNTNQSIRFYFNQKMPSTQSSIGMAEGI
jgi:hypothetical protein